MERRKEPRLKANQSVLVTALGLLGMPPLVGRAIDMSGSGLRLRLPSPIPCGSPVKVETQYMVMLGEVCNCEDDAEDKNGGCIVGLALFHSAPNGHFLNLSSLFR